MNRRHKVLLFLTMVLTGTSLLAGATLSEGLGIFILGAASAWLLGSETATRTYTFVKKLPGKLWPWLRVLLLMILAGCLLVGVAIWSNYNSFLVVVAMSLLGMLFAPLFHLPTERSWVRIVGSIGAIAVFFVTAVLVMTLSGDGQHAERLGELTVPGLIAIPIGTSWLAKGWRLLLKGISPGDAVSDPATRNTEGGKPTAGLYASLFIGTAVLSLWLALLMFSAFTQSVFRLHANSGKSEYALAPVWALLFIILFGWWPYSAWRKILEREPNSTPRNLVRHKRIAVALGAFFSIVLCVAITFGIQNGIDRKATATFLDGMKGFEETAKKIGAIKSREKQTTNDYSEAYAEIEPLEAEFDAKLQRFSDTLSDIRQRDKSRGPINIRKFYSTEPAWMDWDEKLYDALHQVSELTKKEVLVSKQMASLPEAYQVDFWNKNFRPLLEEEDTVRAKINALEKTRPDNSTK